MKGVQIERALVSNTIDVYALLKSAFKEGHYNCPDATPEQIKNYYYVLLDELRNERNFLYLARKGRQYLGYVHGQLLFRPFGQPVMFISMLYVTEKKRKLGVGKLLFDKLIGDAKQIRVANFELMCVDGMQDYWTKKGFKKRANFMSLDKEPGNKGPEGGG